MKKSSWYEAGEEIRNLVQDAVENQDFSKLSETISSVVSQTASGLESVWEESFHNLSNENKKRDPGTAWKKSTADSYQQAADRIRENMRLRNEYREKKRQDPVQPQNLPVPLEKRKVPGCIAGPVMEWVGYGTGGACGIAMSIVAIAGVGSGTLAYMGIPLGILGLFTGTGIAMGISGSRKHGLAKRFRSYAGIIKDRAYCSMEELAATSGRKIKDVKKDIRKMIQRGFFPEAYLDQKETCLITDHETYQQYLTTQQEYDRKQSRENTEKSSLDHLDKECRQLISEGQQYISQIRSYNDKIPGEEISRKLSRLEIVVTRIFSEVEKRPELASDLRKMMSYYLPTTQKLIEAYYQLDQQPVAGENIVTTKKEIENSLDTINDAFEKLLDGFFEHTAWDISTDISVLHTMFAQEGLTESKFGK